MNRDRLYALEQQRVGEFTFDDAVAEVFPDMISRSVPGYGSILSMIEQLSIRYMQPDSNVYDLGCSLGAATLLMVAHVPNGCCIHAVDNSSSMINRLRIRLHDRFIGEGKVIIEQANICDIEMKNASFVVLNLTLQFVLAEQREQLLQRVYDALRPGCALLLTEKICFEDAAQQHLITELHHDFKRAHGYSDLEISQKRTAIENLLIPETMETHISRLNKVGFKTVAPWFQCFNFASLLAVKASADAL